jgi:hypothetical protein
VPSNGYSDRLGNLRLVCEYGFISKAVDSPPSMPHGGIPATVILLSNRAIVRWPIQLNHYAVVGPGEVRDEAEEHKLRTSIPRVRPALQDAVKIALS